jgi:hypothetical protein
MGKPHFLHSAPYLENAVQFRKFIPPDRAQINCLPNGGDTAPAPLDPGELIEPVPENGSKISKNPRYLGGGGVYAKKVLGKKSKFSKNQNFGPEKNPKKLKKN